MRARNIRPNFFKNEELAALSPIARLLYIGLWCLADREGRLEKRPLRIKAELFPYENVDINGELTVIERSGHVVTYVVDGKEYLFIPKFKRHQHVHHTEAPSKLPEFKEEFILTVKQPLTTRYAPPDSLTIDILTTDILTTKRKPLAQQVERRDGFDDFWAAYPKKTGKGAAEKAWKKIKPSDELQQIMAAALDKQKQSIQWQRDAGQFIPYPATWLNQQRWEDDLTEPEYKSEQTLRREQRFKEVTF